MIVLWTLRHSIRPGIRQDVLSFLTKYYDSEHTHIYKAIDEFQKDIDFIQKPQVTISNLYVKHSLMGKENKFANRNYLGKIFSLPPGHT
jgi:hypothetical protein